MNKIKAIKIILSILFLICLLDMPYGYYQCVRFIGMIGFGLLAFENYQNNQTWFVIWISSGVLITLVELTRLRARRLKKALVIFH